MAKHKNKNSTTESSHNGAQRLANMEITDRATQSGITQPHSAKKEGLGPNTKR